jgi:general secretion pathway protein G
MDKYGSNSVSVYLSLLQTCLVPAFLTRGQAQQEYCAGFTIVELVIVVAIGVTLSAIGAPYAQMYIHRGRVTQTITDIRGLEKEIILFRTERGRYPGWPPNMLETLQEIGRETFADPWRTPYQYRNLADGPHTGKGKPKFCRRDRSYNPLNYDFDLYSVGPDREVPTHNQITANKGADDIVRAANGRYVGEGTKF